MARPPKLTEEQRKSLSELEPALRRAVDFGDYAQAKRVTKQIQDLLRPTGHETRLMQSKNWLFEAALEAGEIQTAISGFVGVRAKTSRGTRVYLEASALLAICFLRAGQTDDAKPLIEYVLQDKSSISSDARRRQFRQRIITRFNEEAALAALRGTGDETLDPDEIETEAGTLVHANTIDQLLNSVGSAIPREVIIQILDIDQFSRKALPYNERKRLPSPDDFKQKEEVGRTVFSSVKTVLYRSLCDPKCDVHQAWTKEGLGAVLNKKYIGAAVAAACVNLGIGLKAIAVPVAALILRFGIDVYCDRYQPKGVMIDRKDRDT
jgi:hypothetical protein